MLKKESTQLNTDKMSCLNGQNGTKNMTSADPGHPDSGRQRKSAPISFAAPVLRTLKHCVTVTMMCVTILMLSVPVVMLSGTEVYTGPVVLKDAEKGIGVEEDGTEQDGSLQGGSEDSSLQGERDRSLQDGSLIYSMTPVYPEDVKEGSYTAEALSSSRFFKITDVQLENDGKSMNALITISSTSYSYIYQGTAAEAEAAGKTEWIPADESSGYGQFAIKVDALNKEMPCAAFSKKKQKWYDRDIVVLASSLPDGTVLIDMSEEGGTIADTQDAAIKVIYIALAIIIGGGVLNHFVKKRFYE